MRKTLLNIWFHLSGKIAIVIISIFCFLALLANLLANDNNGLIISHSPNSISANAKPYLTPGSEFNGKTYWLGSDNIGRDVASGLIHGSKWALLVGIFSVCIASIIGLIIGLVSGYFGDDRLQLSWVELCIWSLAIFTSCFYIKYLDLNLLTGSTVIICVVLLVYSILWLMRSNIILDRAMKASYINIPIDIIFSRLIEVFRSIPGLFILLILVSYIQKPSTLSLILIIGCLTWTMKARLVRAELLQVRETNYIKSARTYGLSTFKILLKNALPNALYPLYILFAFSVSSAIILEATLSFLGLGLNSITVTWGSLISAARENYRAWWLAVFPGACIFLVVLAFNLLGDCLRQIYED